MTWEFERAQIQEKAVLRACRLVHSQDLYLGNHCGPPLGHLVVRFITASSYLYLDTILRDRQNTVSIKQVYIKASKCVTNPVGNIKNKFSFKRVLRI